MAEARAAARPTEEVAEPSRGFWTDALARLMRTPAGVAGLLIVAVLAVIAVFGPFLLPYTYYEQDLEAVVAYGGPLPPARRATSWAPTSWGGTCWPGRWTVPGCR